MANDKMGERWKEHDSGRIIYDILDEDGNVVLLNTYDIVRDHNLARIHGELVMLFEQVLVELEHPLGNPEWRAGLICLGHNLKKRIEEMED